MNRKTNTSKRSMLIVFVVLAVAVACLAFFNMSTTPTIPTNPPDAQKSAAASQSEAIGDSSLRSPSTSPSISGSDEMEDSKERETDFFEDRDFDIDSRWAEVDFDKVRAAMPDNLFWELGAPTNDAELLRKRERERHRTNNKYGQVLSGNANTEEIDEYYARRHEVAADYIEFGSHLLEHYGTVLPERDVGLLKLSIQMHRTRLQEMPRRMIEAVERKQRQDNLRAAWLEDEAAFNQTLEEQAQDSAAASNSGLLKSQSGKTDASQ